MKDALVTRGVNVRPRKVRYESCPPRGLVTSGSHWIAPAPRRRPSGRVMRELRESYDHAQAVERARLDMEQARSFVAALKATGKPYRQAANDARMARATWLELTGGLESREIEVSLGSDANKIKAV